MSVTRNQIDQFHHFAIARLNNGGSSLSFDELVAEWREERSETKSALREAFDELDAGLEQPLDEAMEEIRRQLGLSRS